ncbi:MAG TPA: hypothetical protein VFD58_10430 [Blastocatellia bacterium]|nr:hypothetical protein [Blastocatellia bacterium]
MRSGIRILMATLLIIALCSPVPAPAQKMKKALNSKAGKTAFEPAVLWREPTDISRRNLFYGQGGKEHAPQGKFSFLEEDPKGSNPKFEIQDDQGVKWKVKLGPEAQSETAATRLVWAVGYFTDEDYYLPELRVEGMKKLRRGQKFVTRDGIVHGARLERHIKGEKKAGQWSWFDDRLAGTREMNGLKVMMALINNWDLKQSNNEVYEEQGAERRYVIADLGATFGKTGNTMTRSRNSLNDYLKSKFIDRVKPQQVDFVLRSRPFFLFAFNPRYYIERTRMERIVKEIPRSDARWIGSLLARLSDQQIADAFRAAGYSPQEVNAFTGKVRERIAELNKL